VKFIALKNFINEAADIYLFIVRFFKEVFKPRYEISELLKQCYNIGNTSLPIVAVTGLIMGLVITIQSYPAMQSLGTESWLPSVVSVSLIREIVPVITALTCAGKIGSSMGAELGSMKVTEQIDSMDVSGTNPFKYLVVTRVVAATLMLPLLIILGDTVSLYGAYFGVNINQNISFHLFANQVFIKLSFGDVVPSIIKGFFFGFIIGIIGCFKGWNTTNGTEGVGKSANSAVVISIFAVFIIDLIAAQIAAILQIV
jgi:phospholipid/cholesterol/gamma-HCH transport system permease protein